MIIGENQAKPPSLRTLANRESMQAFFTNWIESDELEKEWNKHKETSTHEITLFLEKYTSILADAPQCTQKRNWIEQSITKLEALEKLQLKQRFLTANTHWDNDNKKQLIALSCATSNNCTQRNSTVKITELSNTETMIFMPEVEKSKLSKTDIMDILRKGLTNARAFLNIVNLSETAIHHSVHGQLELQLQVFKNQIYTAHRLQKTWPQKNKALKDAITAYQTLSAKLANMLIHSEIYQKVDDACRGITHMAEFLWSKNYEKPSIHIQHSSKEHANIMVFEPRFVKGSGNKEALWVKKLVKKHPWIKNLPWQILQRPQPTANRDGEGLKIEKATFVSVKKSLLPAPCNEQKPIEAETKKQMYVVDCIPVGELGGTPVPFSIHNLMERYKITLSNQKSIYLGSQTYDDKPPFIKLEEAISIQIEVLTPIITEKRRQKGITIPLADINLARRIFPYKEASLNWLQNRANANQKIREILAQYAIYYDHHQLKFTYLDKRLAEFATLQQQYAASAAHIPIYIEFHDPNIIYNRLKISSCKTREDVNGLKAALKVAVERLETLKEKLFELAVTYKSYYKDIEDVSLVQAFLQSRTIGLYQPQRIPPKVVKATQRLSKKLRKPECPLKNEPNTNRKIQVEILKILQASLIVKSESFESIFGFLYRIVDNYCIGAVLTQPSNQCLKKALLANKNSSRIMWSLLCTLALPLFIVGWAARLSMVFCAAALKIPYGCYVGLQKLVNIEVNKPEKLAAATGILFSAMGKKKLNSKAKTDYALSVLLLICTMINRAINGKEIEGRIPLMSDTRCPYSSKKNIANKALKHQQALKTTGLQIK